MESLVPFRKPQPGEQPEYLHSSYVSTRARAPSEPLIALPPTLSELTGPALGPLLGANASDLTAGRNGPPIGERILVGGRVLDEDGKPLSNTLIELWQCNAAGRYLHPNDTHDAPLDPNFTGVGQVVTDEHGAYAFKTIRPGAYPWRNHHNAFRPAHIHFSLLGPAFATRLVTQMYFPGDPLLADDPIFNSISDGAARNRLVAQLDWDNTRAEYAIAFRFDLVLRGRAQTPWEGRP